MISLQKNVSKAYTATVVRKLLQNEYQVRKTKCFLYPRGKIENELLWVSDFIIKYMLCRPFVAQTQTNKRALDHADCTPPTRQSEVDHTDQEKHCCPEIPRS